MEPMIFISPEEMERIRQEIADAELSALREDRARLDFLESQGDGSAWVARQSETGRGYRLHNTSRGENQGARPTVREAIDAARQRP